MTHSEQTKNSSRRPWVNWAKNQVVNARYVEYPQTLEELRQIVCDVGARGGRMKAVATGLSFSDILQTDDTLVVLEELKAPGSHGALLPLQNDTWYDPTPREPRVRVVCGARIRDLNRALDRAGLAFANLGGFDGQTFIGALSTSTHGSGVCIGPLPSMVRSVDFVSTDGKLYRIEPKNGITDPVKFRRRFGNDVTLVQCDRWFNSVVVSLGCMGVVYSAVVAVLPAFKLVEHRSMEKWREVKAWLQRIDQCHEYRHLEVWINPHPLRSGDHSCLVTKRQFAAPGAEDVLRPSTKDRLEQILFLPSSQEAVQRLIRSEPRFVPTILELGLEQLVTGAHGHVEAGHNVFNVGKVNYAEVISGEYLFPMRNNAFIKGIDALIDTCARARKRGIYQNGPFSVRFTQESEQYLSMMHGGPRASVEIAMFTSAPGAAELIDDYETTALDHEGRPHWGQMHEHTGRAGWVKSSYARLDDWLRTFHELNDRGIFNNHFTDRMGFS